MSWIQKLYETYNNYQSMVGYSTDENKRPLLPICHMVAQSHIEITIDSDGNFHDARLITEKNDAATIIPCTESSASRSGKKPECHPLCDSLQYVAGDFADYGGNVTSGFAKDPEEPYRNYVKILNDWCESCSHPKAQAVLKYIKKKLVVKDLIGHHILYIGQDGKFLVKTEKKKEKGISDIFSVTGSQDKSFIRWQVISPGELETKVWKDRTLWQSWMQHYISTKQSEPICFVTGENALLSHQHPKYIRRAGDGAKLISSNDTSGFTFRGRFLTAEQACGVSLEVSQKAHNALIWLISRQGKVFFVKGDKGRKEPGLTIVAWATSGKPIPQPIDDPTDIVGFDDLPSDESSQVSTAQDLAMNLRKKITGYAKELGDTTGIVVMALDSASKGRMAITYYRELTGSDFLQRIEDWHESCAWIHNYRYIEVQEKESSKKQRKYMPFVGAPAPSDIAEAAYGNRVDDKLRKSTVERILPCIIDGQQIPRDLVESAVRRASNRVGMKDPKDKYERDWNKTLSITCALYRKYNRKENYDMALDINRKTRDYLYGRLLAVADRLEEHALYKAKEKRATNAARYMQRFACLPNKTWMQIYLSLIPYMARLGGAKYYKDLMDEIKCKFDPIDDFNSDKPLSGEFLLAYHCQRAALWKKGDEESSEQEPS